MVSNIQPHASNASASAAITGASAVTELRRFLTPNPSCMGDSRRKACEASINSKMMIHERGCEKWSCQMYAMIMANTLSASSSAHLEEDMLGGVDQRVQK